MKGRGISPYVRRLDWMILAPVLLLVAFGLLAIFSATHNAELIVKFQKQIFWAALGILSLLLVLLAPPRFFHYSAYLLYGAALLLLSLVLVFGHTVSGNAGWFGIGGFGVQPSEFAKIATILALARYLSDRTTSLRSLPDIGKAIGIVALPWLLIFMQPDFGTGLVYWVFFISMLFWSGAEMLLLIVMLSPVLVAVLAIIDLWYFILATLVVAGLYYIVRRNLGFALIFFAFNLSIGFGVQYAYEHLPAYQKARIAVFIDPSQAPLSAGWNVIQSKVAVGSGGLFGKGYLQGTQTQLRFVPEQWTDFIFCVPAEEFGFIGAVIILLLYGLLFIRGLVIAKNLELRFASLVVAGLVAMLAFHVVVSIGMSLGTIPVIGIPLPFMSYGGSFFITSMVAIGIILHAWMYRTGME
ncbi:MAG: rod shape-determining protein RodA [Bacteroidia bacterium]|nr:rod shape-determining protein RodA [Bacteroidia bacterium]